MVRHRVAGTGEVTNVPTEGNRVLKFAARLGFVIAIVIGAASAAEEPKHEPYAPLAHVVVDVANGRVDQLIQMFREFAEARHFRLVLGAYPKRTRQVTNMRLEVGRDSYFYGSNFRHAESFELIAHSHETIAVWQPAWNDLIERISSEFGVRPGEYAPAGR
jgi:hypothetical protein